VSTVRLVLDGAQMAKLTRGPGGLVWNYLERRGQVFKTKARADAPIRTGCLRASILLRPAIEGPTGLTLRVVSDTTPCSPSRTAYSYFVHEGTAPHTITAKNASVLAFPWANAPNGSGMAFFKSVQHPGTAPRPFLRDNLNIFVD
jgi:hypothetical protein